jgi:T5orf172 domain
MDHLSDDELLDALGIQIEEKKTAGRTPREERITAGFEDIVRFVEEHGRTPEHGADKDIFERLYAVRLDCLRELTECRELLQGMDRHGLLEGQEAPQVSFIEALDDEALLAELGCAGEDAENITRLIHVRSPEEIRTAEEVANRTPCPDFESFKPLFENVRRELKQNLREARRFGRDAEIKKGEFFILGGQMVYIADIGELFLTEYNRKDSRLRVIYDNGTESDILMRSLQRALYKDETGRRISSPDLGPLFGDEIVAGDHESGTIYVLRSKSDHPDIAPHRTIIHKIGVTGGDVETRIANAALDPTYLMAEVEIVATYRLADINRIRLEALLHKVFSDARLDLVIHDRFGNPVRPQEWFLVPFPVIDEVVEKIRKGTITGFVYDPAVASLRLTV